MCINVSETGIAGLSNKTERSKRFIKYVEFILFIIAAKTIEVFPDKACYRLASCVGTLLFFVAAPLKSRMVRNLCHAGVSQNLTQAKSMARKTFTNFIKLAVDIFKADAKMKAGKTVKNLRFSGSDISRKMFFPDDGSTPNQVIIVSAHFGNWEVAGQIYAEKTGRQLLSVMRPFDNRRIGDYILSRRTGNGHRTCNKSGGVRTLFGALKHGESISILTDQHASRKDGGIVTQFFGHPARTHATPAKLHLRTGIPIVMLLCRRINDNFQFEFILSDPIMWTPTENPEADILGITQLLNNEMECVIRKYPEQWLWAHRRWLNLDR